MDPVALHVATGRLRRQPAIPRDVIVQLVQADLRCAGDEAVAIVDHLVTGGYLVETNVGGVRIIRRGPRARGVVPTIDDGELGPQASSPAS